jgi:hypothetical protein
MSSLEFILEKGFVILIVWHVICRVHTIPVNLHAAWPYKLHATPAGAVIVLHIIIGGPAGITGVGFH